MNVFICGTIRNVGNYTEKVFENIRKISLLFDKVKIIIAYDNSNDQSLFKLIEMKNMFEIDMDIIINTNRLAKHRTQNISNARNAVLNKIREYKANDVENKWNHFIMMDMDDVCSGNIHLDVLVKHLYEDTWDCLTFNRPEYYDIWALSIYPYVYSCWHWSDPVNVVHHTAHYVRSKLAEIDQNSLLECYSAFNGFAIYKIDKFIDCTYDHKHAHYLMNPEWIEENIKSLPNHQIRGLSDGEKADPNINNDCEHRHFHLQAMKKNNARIRITPLCLFA